MQLFSERIIKLWNGWEVRVLIQVSLVLQIILTFFGARRKYTTRIWIRMLVWSAYLAADWVATVVLGNLASNQSDSNDGSQKSNALQTFWAPFLLLHLGGPDTITAYSLEDNELWLRHLLGLVVQVGLAFYILVRSWGTTALTYIAIPIFIVGIIKYGERTFVLRSSSSQYFKDHLLSDPDPGPNFVVIQSQLEEQQRSPPPPICTSCPCLCGEHEVAETDSDIDESRRQPPESTLSPGASNIPPNLPEQEIQELQQEAENQQQPSTAAARKIKRSKRPPTFFSIFSGRRHKRRKSKHPTAPTTVVSSTETIKPDANYLEVASFLFKRFQYLYADLILSYHERKDSYSKVENRNAQYAFEVVAVELGFMYDVLYTKATIVYSQFGILFRFISFCCSVCALISFSIIIDTHSYPLTDVSITYVLMIGAVILEIYAFIVLLFSDWTKLCMTKSDGCCQCQLTPADRKRWSGCMAQYNLISSCFQNNVHPLCINGIEKLPWIGKLLEKYRYLTWQDVNDDLQNIIFSHLLEKSKEIKDSFSIESCRELLARRGDNVLEKRYGLLDQFRWSISDVEFDHSLLLWHIATDLCYHSENNNMHETKNRSKYLSDYMLYLLVFCPSVLPEGIAEIRYRDTLAECMTFFPEEKLLFCWKRKLSIEKSEVCRRLLRVKFGKEEEEMKGDRSQSVLFYGCRLAKQLQELKIENDPSGERKWEMISEVWVEMLTFAANKCRWKEHGQQLRKGGELLTHVRLLMAHLGLSEQYRIQKLFFTQPHSTLPVKLSEQQKIAIGILMCAVLSLFCYDCLRCRCCADRRRKI